MTTETQRPRTIFTTRAVPAAEFPSVMRARSLDNKKLYAVVDGASDAALYPLLKNSDWEYRCLYRPGVHYEGERLTDALWAEQGDGTVIEVVKETALAPAQPAPEPKAKPRGDKSFGVMGEFYGSKKKKEPPKDWGDDEGFGVLGDFMRGR